MKLGPVCRDPWVKCYPKHESKRWDEELTSKRSNEEEIKENGSDEQ